MEHIPKLVLKLHFTNQKTIINRSNSIVIISIRKMEK